MRALMQAITSNDVAQVYALLQAGGDINRRYLSDYPLQAAIRTGNPELVQAFLESGVEVNFIYGEPGQRNRKTALLFAVQCNQPEICQFLLMRGGRSQLSANRRVAERGSDASGHRHPAQPAGSLRRPTAAYRFEHRAGAALRGTAHPPGVPGRTLGDGAALA